MNQTRALHRSLVEFIEDDDFVSDDGIAGV
jgi:hypothetical protein